MRVISGEKRRAVLRSPKGDKIRPTSDQIKETLFNMIGNDVYGAVFWDLFAGTGQIGIEALSRGAKHACFMDKDRDAIKLVNENISHVGYEDKASVFIGPLPGVMKKAKTIAPDIIFMDPPYYENLYKAVFEEIASLDFINSNIMIIAEADKNEDFSFVSSLGFSIEKEKIYKSSKHVWLYFNGS